MSSDKRKIKKYGDFSMQKPSCYKVSNLLAITGEYKPGFFAKKRKFEIIIYYTPLKGRIMDINAIDIEPSFYPFQNGDNISLAREWAKVNNYNIVIDKKIFG